MRALLLPTSFMAILFSSFSAWADGNEYGEVFVEPSEPASYGEPPSAYGQSGPPPQGHGGPAGYGHGPRASYQAPPPPKRTGAEWNIRFNPFDLIEGRVSGAVEYSVAGPFTVGLAPTYVYGRPVYLSGDGYDIGGWALALQPGIWLGTKPFRGLGLKLHLEHESVTYRIKLSDGSEEKTSLGLNKIGAMLASQSLHAGWFSLSYGLGLKKNLSYDEEKHTVTCPGYDPGEGGCIVAAGIGKGFEIIGELGIGVVF